MHRICALFLATVGVICMTNTTHAASPCQRTDRVYEVRRCQRIQQRNQQLREPSLAQPLQRTGAVVQTSRGRPVPGYTEAGVVLRRSGSRVWVVQVVANSPAERAGLQVQDDILELDGQPVGSNVSAKDVQALLGGKQDTSVVVTLGRRNGGRVTTVLQRQRSNAEALTAQVQEGIVVATVRNFSAGMPMRLEAVLREQTQVRQPRGIVLDVRSNPGGELSAVLHTLGLLLEEGSTVATLQTARSADLLTVQGKPAVPLRTPVAVLVAPNASDAVGLLVGGLKTGNHGHVTVIRTATPAAERAAAALLLHDANGLRVFRSPVDALLLPFSEQRIRFDAQYVQDIADVLNPPPDATNDPALSYALDLLR